MLNEIVRNGHLNKLSDCWWIQFDHCNLQLLLLLHFVTPNGYNLLKSDNRIYQRMVIDKVLKELRTRLLDNILVDQLLK